MSKYPLKLSHRTLNFVLVPATGLTESFGQNRSTFVDS